MPDDHPYTPAELEAGRAGLRAHPDALLMAEYVLDTYAAAVLDAAAPLIAGRVVEPYRKRIEALEALLACYRTGRQPSEALHRRLEQTRAALEGDQNA